MSDQQWFELDVTVTSANGEQSTISREYQSKDAASAHKAASEVFEAIAPEARARMRSVNDGK